MSRLRVSQMRILLMLFTTLFSLFLALPTVAEEEADPAEIAIGERLFMETRFAQYFASRGVGGDPTVDTTQTLAEPLPGPFAGESMNCSSCHLVDQQLDTVGGGMRTYSDFARRSPIPVREDGQQQSVRNSQALVNTSISRRLGVMFHFDGEFDSLQGLVEGTLTGRNYGWLPDETEQAVAHIAQIVRTDNGMGDLAQELGGSYAVVLEGVGTDIPAELVLPEELRLDVTRASDQEIFQHVAKLIAIYVEDLEFLRDEDGNYNGSPYDRFLALNQLPPRPQGNETVARYSQRLMLKLNRLDQPIFVSAEEQEFAFHDQSFAFGPLELKGLRLFLSRPSFFTPESKAGNCVACHPAPDFTDFALHNTGITQLEYDGIHGEGAFNQLTIPDLVQRTRTALQWLPATTNRPTAQETMRAIPHLETPGQTDLGSWNLFANEDFPAAQEQLGFLLCREQIWAMLQRPRAMANGAPCADANLLQRSIATFKTPSLRDLGHSAPYMHNGQLDRLEDVVSFYIAASAQAQSGQMRNPAPGLMGMNIDGADIAALSAFLRALNEDYE